MSLALIAPCGLLPRLQHINNIGHFPKALRDTGGHSRSHEDGIPFINRRDVAEMFGKQHQHVFRAIDNLLKSLTNENFRWFRQTDYEDAKGELRPSFDITRDGFSLLVMGWTGERAIIQGSLY